MGAACLSATASRFVADAGETVVVGMVVVARMARDHLDPAEMLQVVVA
jgi:hypothetical protein